MNKNAKILIIAALLILVCAGVITLLYFLLAGNGNLNIDVFPSDTTYIISGKSYKGAQNLNLRSGQYTITFSRNYYQTKTLKVKVVKDQTMNLKVNMELDKYLQSTFANLSGNDLKNVDQSDQKAYQDTIKSFEDKNPIVKDLPLITNNYRIDYGFYNDQDPTDVTIEITIFSDVVTDQNRDQLEKEALNSIAKYKIDSVKIKWYESPKSSFPQ